MIERIRRRYIVPGVLKKWSVWVAGFWGAVGAVIAILSSLLYQGFDFRVGLLLIFVSASFAIARFLKQPGTS